MSDNCATNAQTTDAVKGAGSQPDDKAKKAGCDQPSGNSSNTADKTTDALQNDSWGGGLFHDAVGLWHKTFGGESKKQATSIDDVNSIGSGLFTFDNIFAPAKPAESAATKSSGVLSDIGGWFSEQGKKIGDTTQSLFDWFNSSSSSDGSKRTVEAKDGTVKYDGTTSSGEKVTVTDNQKGIHSDVNGVQIDQNKDGPPKDTHYKGHDLTAENRDGVQTIKNKDGTAVQWDSNKKHGTYEDASGKVIFEFGSLEEGRQKLDHYIKYHLKPGESLTQLDQGSAAAAADSQLHNQQHTGNDTPAETKIYVDKNGDYAVVRKDGMVIKTFKNGTVEFDKFDKDTNEIHRMQIRKGEDGRRHAYVEDPNTHQFTQEVDYHGHHRLPKGLTLGENGTVQINGEQVVSADGNVHTDQTNIKVTAGTMTTQADAGTVTVNAGNGQSTVANPEAGTITANHDGTFTNSDDKAGFNSWDPRNDTVHAFQQPDGSGAVLGPEGMRITEPNGQVTEIGNHGSVKSCDRDGLDLFNIDDSGNVSLFDGTHINADGHVYDDSGSDFGSGWNQHNDSGSEQSITGSAISQSSSAMGSVAAKFGGNSVVTPGDVADLLSADGALAQAEGALGWDDQGLRNMIASQRASLASMIGQAQILASLYADLQSRGLGNTEIAQAQKEFQNKTMEFATQEADNRHRGVAGNEPVFNANSKPSLVSNQTDDDSALRRTA